MRDAMVLLARVALLASTAGLPEPGLIHQPARKGGVEKVRRPRAIKSLIKKAVKNEYFGEARAQKKSVS